MKPDMMTFVASVTFISVAVIVDSNFLCIVSGIWFGYELGKGHM